MSVSTWRRVIQSTSVVSPLQGRLAVNHETKNGLNNAEPIRPRVNELTLSEAAQAAKSKGNELNMRV